MQTRDLFKTGLSAAVAATLTFWSLSMAGDAPPAAPRPDDKGVVTYVKGETQKKTAASDWAPVPEKSTVDSGDTMQTKRKSRAEVAIETGKTVRLDENTIVDLVKLLEQEQQKREVQLDVKEGQVWASISTLGAKDDFKINSPFAGAAVRGTVFNYAVTGDNLKLDVFKGAVEIYNPFKPVEMPKPGQLIIAPHDVQGPRDIAREEWTKLLIQSRQSVTVGGQGAAAPAISPVTQQTLDSEWVKWNQGRDQ